MEHDHPKELVDLCAKALLGSIQPEIPFNPESNAFLAMWRKHAISVLDALEDARALKHDDLLYRQETWGSRALVVGAFKDAINKGNKNG